MFTIGSLILGTVLTGPAARPVTAPMGDLANPFENAPAAVDSPVTELRSGSGSASGDLVDPFSGTPKAVAPAKRLTVRPSARPSGDLRDPWAPVGEGEAAAKRIEPRAKADKGLHAPFPKAPRRAMTSERARQIEATADLHNPFE